ncbi:ribokinase [Tateyamaria omphalii]|uniref:ribokinase n=1 Tax=Tateyamaria omphalii TaxID=299262 RepID=UPI001C99EE71|nr:ribokinase [Tateyamaria omphalii]MBY5933388.1 ribokinase [Tateyamaria omphalii]
MAVWNLGSINIDNVYRVPHLPAAGETLAAMEFSQGLGGKGANMSVAIARAAARVAHIGAVGPEGKWTVDRLMEYGVDTRPIQVMTEHATGHANIAVAEDGENQIVLFAGSNRAISSSAVGQALAEASPGDTFITQNETNGQREAAEMARQLGLRVVYAAAPFDPDAVRELLPFVDLLVLNQVEAEQLEAALGKPVHALGIEDVVVTLGSDGCLWLSGSGEETHVPAISVTPVDTTGAGDTFTGYLVAGLDRGMPMRQALDLATQAGALMVTRLGTADVIPDLKEIEDAKLG